MKQIYLDYNATTPIAPAVQTSMLPFLAEHFGNPSSGHAMGVAAQAAVDDARVRVAELIGVDPEEIFFTAGGTESNNWVLKGLGMPAGRVRDGHLVISALEHPAIVEPAEYLRQAGMEVTVVPCNRLGVVRSEMILEALRPDTFLVSVMHANNEIGTLQPISEISAICRERGILVHTDAAQSVGKVPVRARELGVDFLSLAGHKFYAPKGVGALYIRAASSVDPLLHGGGQERGARAGTENVPFIVGLGKAAQLASNSLDLAHVRMRELRDRLEDRLRDAMGPSLTINGDGAERLPNTLSVNFPDVDARELLRRIPDLCASTGAACHAGGKGMSSVLASIGLDQATARGTIRLSLGWYTEEEEIDRAVSLLVGVWESIC